MVSTQSLARQAEQLRLGDHLILGRGEEKTGGRFKQALLADAYEALIAAHLSRRRARAARGVPAPRAEGRARRRQRADVRARPQVGAAGAAAGAWPPLPEYRVSGEAGPDHRKTFSVEVVVGGEVLGTATGRAKKEAEQEAARLAAQRNSNERRSTLYAAIGEEGFARLVRAFYAQVPGDDVLGPMYPAHDLAGAEERLRDFLIGRFGGPPRYIEQRGHPRLRMRHRRLPSTKRRRNRWVMLMDRALDDARLPDDVTSLLREFFHATATF